MPDPPPAARPAGASPDPLEAMLRDAALWEEPPGGLEEQIVAAIEAERPATQRGGPVIEETTPDAAVPRLADRRRSRRMALVGFGSGIAATLALVAVLTIGGPGGDLSTDPTDAPMSLASVEVALTPTDLAPETARADAVITEGRLGTRLVMNVQGLPPAEEGTYYEAWMRQSPEIGVSAGTFHLRGGDGEIELWSAVSPEEYPLLTVTIQDEDGGAESSGDVVLSARVDQ